MGFVVPYLMWASLVTSSLANLDTRGAQESDLPASTRFLCLCILWRVAVGSVEVFLLRVLCIIFLGLGAYWMVYCIAALFWINECTYSTSHAINQWVCGISLF